MLKPVKPRGDTSVAFHSTGLYICEPAVQRNSTSGQGSFVSMTTVLKTSLVLFRCVKSVMQVLCLPL